MRGLAVGVLCAVCALLSVACSDGASSDPALGSRLRIAGAQFVPGATPAAQGGPEVSSLELLSSTIWPGYANKPVRGALGSEATAATLALSGDSGFWLVPAGPPDVATPDSPSFHATASFARDLPASAYTLEARAVDGQGRFGEPRRQVLSVLPVAPSRAVAGALIVTLTWDSSADVDLHVIDPSGSEIFHGATSSRDPFRGAAEASYGSLDVDSNADCAGDELRQEDVTWSEAPPSGHYSVRVDTTSLCGAPAARWRLSVTLEGQPLASASGIVLDSDTWGPHDRGAGLLALGFDVP